MNSTQHREDLHQTALRLCCRLCVSLVILVVPKGRRIWSEIRIRQKDSLPLKLKVLARLRLGRQGAVGNNKRVCGHRRRQCLETWPPARVLCGDAIPAARADAIDDRKHRQVRDRELCAKVEGSGRGETQFEEVEELGQRLREGAPCACVLQVPGRSGASAPWQRTPRVLPS